MWRADVDSRTEERPTRYPCLVASCSSNFSRKDNMMSHVRHKAKAGDAVVKIDKNNVVTVETGLKALLVRGDQTRQIRY